jgi:hypothetical protein
VPALVLDAKVREYGRRRLTAAAICSRAAACAGCGGALVREGLWRRGCIKILYVKIVPLEPNPFIAGDGNNMIHQGRVWSVILCCWLGRH